MTARRRRTAPSGSAIRMLRAAVFAAVCVVLAGAGHTFASCASVPLWTLGAGFLGVLVCAAPLAGRTRSLPGIVALLAVGQTVLHILFGLGQHAMASTGAVTAATTDTALVARAARLLCGVPLATISPAQAQRILADARIGAGGTGTAGSGTGAGMDMASMNHPADALASPESFTTLLPTLPMLLGHVLAAVATGWLLRRGDLALLRLMRLSAHGVAEGALVRSLRGALALARALRTGLPGTPGTAPPAPRAWTLVPLGPSDTQLQHTVIRRGPPTAPLVLAA
ncbi:hypothetical protein PV396_19920 [Streptomyces sp. ME02-8801-2C]|uniref:hypothetical protein n=1 Tax=Streptomyces sp. ME02-8801-2C TaxID=3028680 RepID=UPI0029A1D9BA|nr:hypothetical protein [Streptomyces sp. ME02-8801-2C]MDX3454185.1 hypothetical protein [Streptomyces sp. ME02-8801-2C]